MGKKREDYVSAAARNAAQRHEDKTGHDTTELYDDDNNMDGMCCYQCDWMRYNVQPRRRQPDMPLGKARLQLAARLFVAAKALSVEAAEAFSGLGLTEDETEYLQQAFDEIGRRMLGRHTLCTTSSTVIEAVRWETP